MCSFGATDILDETKRSILGDRPDLTATSLDKRFSAMGRAFPALRVEGYQELVASMTNDPGDRHVLAAVITGGAGVIVMHNVSQTRHLVRPRGSGAGKLSTLGAPHAKVVSLTGVCEKRSM